MRSFDDPFDRNRSGDQPWHSQLPLQQPSPEAWPEADEFAIHLEFTEVVDDDAEAAFRLLVEEAFEGVAQNDAPGALFKNRQQ